MKPWCLSQRTCLLIVRLAYPHRTTFTLSFVLTFKGPVCVRQLYKRPFLFERYVTTHWHDLKHKPFTPHLHLKLCMLDLVQPRLPMLRRCKQHFVCRIQFSRAFILSDRPQTVPVGARRLFCFLSGDEESCPFSFNKQTSVWINKLKGSGCVPLRTVCSVSFSVSLSCEWAEGAPFS